MANRTGDVGVVIVGAGFAGLGMGMALKRELGFNDFIIYERDSDVGGTWKANTYPGCSSDSLIHAYGYSFLLNPKWESSRGSQSQILEYIHDVTEKHGLRPHCVFDTSVIKAEWDDGASIWRITTKDKKGQTSVVNAKVFISASGILADPYIPAFPGIDTFKGPLFHSARYRHDVDLRGKKVAVIGNGCTAAQIVPAISEDPNVDVTVYARTRMWYAPGTPSPYTPFWRKVYATVPFVLRFHHIRCMLFHELFYFLVGFRNPFMRKQAKKAFTNYMKENAPKEYIESMTPDFDPGCRRMIFDNGYLASLHRPNTTPAWSGIAKIDEGGILDTEGVYRPCDVIICATGFVTDKSPIDIRGHSGKALEEYYKEQGGPTAYLGSTVPGFPNFMFIQGPNTTTGHASVVYSEECQFAYAVKLFKPVLSHELDSVQPTHEATARYNSWLSARLTSSVYMQCTSWYRTGGTGKVFSSFPGPLTLFWWLTYSPRWADYDVRGSQKDTWLRKRRFTVLSRYLSGFFAIAVALVAVRAVMVSGTASASTRPASLIRSFLSRL